MPLPIKARQLAAKIESTPGTLESLGASDATLVASDIVFGPDFKLFKRNILTADFDKFAQLVGQQAAGITFKTPLQGASGAGTAPKVGTYLKGAGMDETVVASTSVTYGPVSSGNSNLSLAQYEDDQVGSGLKSPIAGAMARGCRLVGKIGEPTMWEFDFFGKYVANTDTAPLSPTLDAIVPPVLLGATFTIDSFAAAITEFSIDFAPSIILRGDITEATGYSSALYMDREPTVSFNPEKTLKATYDWYNKFKTGAQGAFSLSYGSGAGQVITITLPKVQYIQISEADRDGLGVYEITGAVNRDSVGDDSWSIAFT